MVNELEACTRLPPVGVILPMSPAVEDLGVSAMHGSLDQNLSVSLFYPWGKERHVVNKLHFLHSGGLELLCRLYALVHTVDQWDSLPYWLQCVECICGQSLTNFMETFEFRRHVLKHNGLEMCFKSLLRCSYQDQGAILARQNDALLLHAMEVALYAVCNLSEVPECHLPIAQRADVLRQALDMSTSYLYTCKTSVVAVSVFICIAQSYDTHKYVATPGILERLIACCTHRETQHATEHSELLAFKCYTGLALAQLVIPSLHLIPTDLHAPIEKLMSQTLRSLSPPALKAYDSEEGLVWCTLLPYIKLLYLQPDRRRVDCEMTPTACSIVALSRDVILLCLHSALLREVHQSLLVKEKLVDYVVCLPWIVPSRSRPRARELVADLATSIGVDPPRLLTLAKATLSKQCQQGLEGIIGVWSARDIAARITTCN